MTFHAIGIANEAIRPQPTLILAMYCLFIIFYLAWDWPARRDDTESDEEEQLYNQIIRWEIVSLIILLLALTFSIVGPRGYALWAAVIAFAVVTAFQVVTLPVEFDPGRDR